MFVFCSFFATEAYLSAFFTAKPESHVFRLIMHFIRHFIHFFLYLFIVAYFYAILLEKSYPMNGGIHETFKTE